MLQAPSVPVSITSHYQSTSPTTISHRLQRNGPIRNVFSRTVPQAGFVGCQRCHPTTSWQKIQQYVHRQTSPRSPQGDIHASCLHPRPRRDHRAGVFPHAASPKPYGGLPSLEGHRAVLTEVVVPMETEIFHLVVDANSNGRAFYAPVHLPLQVITLNVLHHIRYGLARRQRTYKHCRIVAGALGKRILIRIGFASLYRLRSVDACTPNRLATG